MQPMKFFKSHLCSEALVRKWLRGYQRTGNVGCKPFRFASIPFSFRCIWSSLWYVDKIPCRGDELVLSKTSLERRSQYKLRFSRTVVYGRGLAAASLKFQLTSLNVPPGRKKLKKEDARMTFFFRNFWLFLQCASLCCEQGLHILSLMQRYSELPNLYLVFLRTKDELGFVDAKVEFFHLQGVE